MVGDQIARNIKFFREQKGWTQQTLADKLLVSRSVIGKWESNLSTPDIHLLVKLTNVFSISLDDLVGVQSFHHEILKDVRLKYSTDPEQFDQEVSQIVEYIVKSPMLKDVLFRMQSLTIKKQQSLQTIFKTIVDQYEHQ
ncbi:MAG TPA: helix-turn-helix transcriptional regulator [Virgibacillus sp.]|nr:helix-turn-helix transcriptional regulator [Virgibacillus sp.]